MHNTGTGFFDQVQNRLPFRAPIEQCVTYREKSAGWNMLISASAKKKSMVPVPGLHLSHVLLHYALWLDLNLWMLYYMTAALCT